MIERSKVKAQLGHTLEQIDLPHLGEKIEGKVRDCYVVGDKRVLIASDRLSAFDVVLTTIPFKGQLLTQLAKHWFVATEHIIPNHIIEYPHPNVMISQEVDIVPVEVVVRGYLTGSAWRDYSAGNAVSGIELPQGLNKSQRFDTPLITPSTKAAQGEHDMPISSEEIVRSNLVERSLWDHICETALQLFALGSSMAQERGLILVDTKYEFGLHTGAGGTKTLMLADEVHTQDSSRYWLSKSYQERFESGQDPEMLDKEFVRQKLIDLGYMGDGAAPELDDDFRVDTALKYMEAYEILTGEKFEAEVGSPVSAIANSLAALRSD